MKKIILPISAVATFALSATGFCASASHHALSVQLNRLNAKTLKLERQVAALTKKVRKQHHVVIKKAHVVIAPVVNPWPHFVTVTTTPFLGKGTDFDGLDLLYNVSSNNEDLRLITQKQNLENMAAAQGYEFNRPVLQLSGVMAGQAYSADGYNRGATEGMSLAAAELDMNAMASSWATGFMSMDYSGAPISTGNRQPNSQIFLARGFATIGNLNRCPVYFTSGLLFVPFGRYASGMVTTPLTQSFARIRTSAALLGFSLNNGLHGSAYGYTGSQTSGGQSLFKQGGVDLGYKHRFDLYDSYSVGMGWVSNIADSQGQQNTGRGTATNQFGGFAVPSALSTNNNTLVHAVDAVDVHTTVAIGPVTFGGEYIGATRRFAVADMTYNSLTVGAKPQAMHAEIDYLLPYIPMKHHTVIGFGYGHTWQALALNLPAQSYSVFLNTSIWRETGESIEFRHDDDYAASAYATGRGAGVPIPGTGRSRNSVTAQVGVYF